MNCLLTFRCEDRWFTKSAEAHSCFHQP